MTFNDIFKSKFLENLSGVTIFDMVFAILLSFLVGILIFWIYKKTYTGVMYSASFGVTLIALTMITTIVIMAVTSNVVLSLGMVGALSIVRFRTAVKEPLDLAFLFWSIAVGIILAAGLIPLAVFGSIFISLMLVLFTGWKTHDNPYILILRCDSAAAEEKIGEMLAASVKKLMLKSKSVTRGEIELNYEVRLKDSDTEFINILAEASGVSDVMLVSYNGDYVG